MSIAEKDMFTNGSFINNAYNWHFNRSKDYYSEKSRCEIMKQVWNKIKHKYETSECDLSNNYKFSLNKGLLRQSFNSFKSLFTP